MHKNVLTEADGGVMNERCTQCAIANVEQPTLVALRECQRIKISIWMEARYNRIIEQTHVNSYLVFFVFFEKGATVVRMNLDTTTTHLHPAEKSKNAEILSNYALSFKIRGTLRITHYR